MNHKLTKKVVSLLVSILFFIWILPLGAFIAPEKEEAACNGQRGICLCSHLIAKHVAETVAQAGSVFKSGGAAQKEKNGFSSLNDFLVLKQSFSHNILIKACSKELASSYQYAFIRPIDHIPKV